MIQKILLFCTIPFGAIGQVNQSVLFNNGQVAGRDINNLQLNVTNKKTVINKNYSYKEKDEKVISNIEYKIHKKDSFDYIHFGPKYGVWNNAFILFDDDIYPCGDSNQLWSEGLFLLRSKGILDVPWYHKSLCVMFISKSGISKNNKLTLPVNKNSFFIFGNAEPGWPLYFYSYGNVEPIDMLLPSDFYTNY